MSKNKIKLPKIFFSYVAIIFFAMCLMHLGGIVYIVGDTTTPAARTGDLLITISGSGKTQTVLDIAHMARKAGAKIATIGLDIGKPSPMEFPARRWSPTLLTATTPSSAKPSWIWDWNKATLDD